MRYGILEFSSLMLPVEDLLENFYTHARKRTRLESGRVSFQASGWSRYKNAFEQCTLALEHQVTLPHVDY